MTNRLIIILGYSLSEECKIQPILKSRLDSALEIYQPGDKILVCGRMPPKFLKSVRCEKLTEAKAMEQYLLTAGVALENIIKEEKSTTTFGNAYYGFNFIKAESPEEILIIANEFHYPLINYSFSKVLGSNYNYSYRIIPDASLDVAVAEIDQWKEIVQRMVNNYYSLLFTNVVDGDIKTITSIIKGSINPEFENYARKLLGLDQYIDITDFIAGADN